MVSKKMKKTTKKVSSGKKGIVFDEKEHALLKDCTSRAIRHAEMHLEQVEMHKAKLEGGQKLAKVLEKGNEIPASLVKFVRGMIDTHHVNQVGGIIKKLIAHGAWE